MNVNLRINPGSSEMKKSKTGYLSLASAPSSISSSTTFGTNDLNIERRLLKHDSQNPSFKGLFYKPVWDSVSTSQELVDIAKKHLGSSAEDLFLDVKKSQKAQKMFSIDDAGMVKFQKKSITKLLVDGMLYPFIILPKDLLNSTVGNLRKVKPLKNWAEKTYNSEALKNMRQESKIDSKVNALRGLFETIEKNKDGESLSSELFQRSVKMFDPNTGNYDTKHERSLCRIVSGVIPAVFLANDAYNLSMMYKDDKNGAEKEQKTRFKQEVVRVGGNAYLMLITLGALQKFINNSAFGIVLNTALTTLFTESTARLASGKSLTRLTPEKAKAINAKNGVVFEGSETEKKEDKATEAKAHDPLINLNTFLKASAAIIATGFGIKHLRKISTVDDMFKSVAKPFKDNYNKLVTNSDNKVELKKFNEVLGALEENGFKELAKKYHEVAKNSIDGEFVHLGEKDKKIKPLVNFFIAPFKFAFNVVKFPYSITDKLVKGVGKALLKKSQPKEEVIKENIQKLKNAKIVDSEFSAKFKAFQEGFESEKYSEAEIDAKLSELNKISSDKKSLAMSMDKMIKKAEKAKMNPAEFKSFVSDNMLKAFNNDNVSNIANNELANLAKTSATATTIWFLMTDNYNMAMLKSNGDDVDGAKEKFKGRFIQEGSRLFYQTLLIDLFNTTFKSQYNSSLMGMTWITTLNTTLGEMLNRKSIGMPVMKHSQKELAQIEEDKQNSTGFIKGYYDFMARLTGKKTLAERKAEAASK